MAIKFANETSAAGAMTDAMQSGDKEKMQQAWQGFHDSIAQSIRDDFEAVQASGDTEVLSARGYRQLTTAENKWYQKVTTALKSTNPQQSFAELVGSDIEDDIMPTTILEDVYKDLEQQFPLLQAVNFQYVGYITKWVLNDHTVQKAVWGPVNEAITKEITSGFRVINIDQNKLSAFAQIENDMLDLGPTFLDAYIRKTLVQALSLGLEYGILKGTGLNEPVGIIRDIHEGVSVSSSTGYPAKTKVAVTGFGIKEYGELLAKMCKTEKGAPRSFAKVIMVCNQADYMTKVMPATTVLNTAGAYVNNLFPFPTDCLVSNVLEDGEAVVFIPEDYAMFVGGNKNGVIENSTDYKFLEDVTTFKVKQFATGRCTDNTAALYLDITGLEPAYIAIKDMSEPTA